MTPAGPRTVFVVKDDDPIRAALGTRELTILWRLPRVSNPTAASDSEFR